MVYVSLVERVFIYMDKKQTITEHACHIINLNIHK